MSEPFQFDYYYGAEADQFSFVRIPKLLLRDPRFMEMSYGAIIIYAILLDRMNLSIKNGWHDEMNRVYIRYKVTDLTDVIGKSEDTVSRYLKELEDIGLIERPRKGLAKGKVTYLKNFISPELKDKNLITRKNAGNGEDETHDDQVIFDKKSDDQSILITLEPAKNPITRKSAGNIPGKNAGNIPRRNAGNIPREIADNDKSNNELSNNNINNTYHYPNHISYTGESAGSDSDWMRYKQLIRENIEYESLCSRDNGRDQEEIDGLVDIMTEVMVSNQPKIAVASDEYPIDLVKGKLMKITSRHIEYILDCFHATTGKIYNIKRYLLTALFNAPSTIDSYYRAEVNHDLYVFD